MDSLNINMDAKDYAILRELDINFRQSFSSIGKKVGLSKNSIALRFEKLKDYTLHNTVGINNEILGLTLVKVYYSFDFYDEAIEKEIITEIQKHGNMLWAARYYGQYDLCISLLIDNLSSLISQVSNFNKKFSNRINQKEIQIIYKQFFFRNNFIHKQQIIQIDKITKTEKRIGLSEVEKKIITLIRNNPRINVIEIAKTLGITSKTASTKLKNLEENKIIMGYFMTLDPVKFNFNTFKLLIQIQNLENKEEFENYLKSIPNIKYITKMLGLWDYEIDIVYPTITELQKQIDSIKQKFPNILKKITILSFGKRVVTCKNHFLV